MPLISSVPARSAGRATAATVFGYRVPDPERYGVVSFDAAGRAASIEEKPAHARSRRAVTGLHFHDSEVVEIAAGIGPSARGELEITDVNKRYLERGARRVECPGLGYAWFDAGTHDSLLEASGFVRTIGKRLDRPIAVPEEIAFANGWIDRERSASLAQGMGGTGYGSYLLRLVGE